MNDPPRFGPALIDGRLLRLFDVLYTTRSVSRAAEQLGQAQPTISIWLNRLRRELGDPLFIRSGSGMAPTPRAESLIGRVRTVIDLLRDLQEQEPRFEPASSRRRFRICMTDASHVTLLPRLLATIHTAGPGIEIEALQISQDTARLLQLGEADLALGLVPELETDFFQQALYTQDWVCLASAHHPRISASLTPSLYAAEAHVNIAGGTGHSLLESALRNENVHRRVLLELPGFLGLPAIVATTDLIATLPRHTGEMLAAAHGLRVFPCPLPIPSFTVKQHWHARHNRLASNRWLRRICAGLFRTAGRAEDQAALR